MITDKQKRFVQKLKNSKSISKKKTNVGRKSPYYSLVIRTMNEQTTKNKQVKLSKD